MKRYALTKEQWERGKALHYLLEQWPYLVRYLENGRPALSQTDKSWTKCLLLVNAPRHENAMFLNND